MEIPFTFILNWMSVSHAQHTVKKITSDIGKHKMKMICREKSE